MSIGESIRLLFLAYSPFFRGDKKRINGLRVIIRKLRNSENGFFDPVRRSFNPHFYSFIQELIKESALLRSAYRNTLNGTEAQRQTFEKGLAAYIIRLQKHDPDELTFKAVRKTAAAEGSSDIKNIDRIFTRLLKLFSHSLFKAAGLSLGIHSALADFVDVDHVKISDEFPLTKQGNADRLDGNLITDSLEDLYFTSSYLKEIETVTLKPVFKYLARLHNSGDPKAAYSEMMKHSISLSRMIELLHKDDFLLDIIRLLRDDPGYQPAKGNYNSDFPSRLKSACTEQFSKYRQLHIQHSNQELLKSRMTDLFGNNELLPVQMYNLKTSAIFTENGLSSFKYVNAFRICKSFYQLFFEPDIRPAVQALLLEAEFHHESDRNSLSDYFEGAVLTGERIAKFEEDLSIPSFSLIAPYIEKLKVGIIEKKEKLRAEKAVEKLEKDADEIIQQVFAVFTDLNLRLSKLILDIRDQNPRLLANALYLRNRKCEFCSSIESSEVTISKFLKLLRTFSINIADTKSGIKSRDDE